MCVRFFFCCCVVIIFVFNVMHFENCFLFKEKDSKLILWTSEEFTESKKLDVFG